jgi:hypothetical protein
MNKVLYLIGSLRNDRVPKLAQRLRKELPDVEVFDDWYSAGEEADDYWKTYEQGRRRTYEQALEGYAAKHVFEFDKCHLDRSSHVLLVLPAGKSGHMELMYGAYGVGANAAILLDPEDVRWDVMYQFIPTILSNDDSIAGWINKDKLEGENIGRQSTTTRASVGAARGTISRNEADTIFELITRGRLTPE